eukprot:GHVP01068014.1.p1 GENE.GHVP01068014.1~~GHVP01068014.1.p1  ORF type:complete len:1567 (+),score=309.75 GHVP01068014.1:869-5569(+)
MEVLRRFCAFVQSQRNRMQNSLLSFCPHSEEKQKFEVSPFELKFNSSFSLYGDRITAVSASNFSDTIAMSTSGGKLMLLTPGTPSCEFETIYENSELSYTSICLSGPTDQYILCGTENGLIELFVEPNSTKCDEVDDNESYLPFKVPGFGNSGVTNISPSSAKECISTSPTNIQCKNIFDKFLSTSMLHAESIVDLSLHLQENSNFLSLSIDIKGTIQVAQLQQIAKKAQTKSPGASGASSHSKFNITILASFHTQRYIGVPSKLCPLVTWEFSKNNVRSIFTASSLAAVSGSKGVCCFVLDREAPIPVHLPSNTPDGHCQSSWLRKAKQNEATSLDMKCLTGEVNLFVSKATQIFLYQLIADMVGNNITKDEDLGGQRNSKSNVFDFIDTLKNRNSSTLTYSLQLIAHICLSFSISRFVAFDSSVIFCVLDSGEYRVIQFLEDSHLRCSNSGGCVVRLQTDPEFDCPISEEGNSSESRSIGFRTLPWIYPGEGDPLLLEETFLLSSGLTASKHSFIVLFNNKCVFHIKLASWKSHLMRHNKQVQIWENCASNLKFLKCLLQDALPPFMDLPLNYRSRQKVLKTWTSKYLNFVIRRILGYNDLEIHSQELFKWILEFGVALNLWNFMFTEILAELRKGNSSRPESAHILIQNFVLSVLRYIFLPLRIPYEESMEHSNSVIWSPKYKVDVVEIQDALIGFFEDDDCEEYLASQSEGSNIFNIEVIIFYLDLQQLNIHRITELLERDNLFLPLAYLPLALMKDWGRCLAVFSGSEERIREARQKLWMTQGTGSLFQSFLDDVGDNNFPLSFRTSEVDLLTLYLWLSKSIPIESKSPLIFDDLLDFGNGFISKKLSMPTASEESKKIPPDSLQGFFHALLSALVENEATPDPSECITNACPFALCFSMRPLIALGISRCILEWEDANQRLIGLQALEILWEVTQATLQQHTVASKEALSLQFIKIVTALHFLEAYLHPRCDTAGENRNVPFLTPAMHLHLIHVLFLEDLGMAGDLSISVRQRNVVGSELLPKLAASSLPHVEPLKELLTCFDKAGHALPTPSELPNLLEAYGDLRLRDPDDLLQEERQIKSLLSAAESQRCFRLRFRVLREKAGIREAINDTLELQANNQLSVEELFEILRSETYSFEGQEGQIWAKEMLRQIKPLLKADVIETTRLLWHCVEYLESNKLNSTGENRLKLEFNDESNLTSIEQFYCDAKKCQENDVRSFILSFLYLSVFTDSWKILFSEKGRQQFIASEFLNIFEELCTLHQSSLKSNCKIYTNSDLQDEPFQEEFIAVFFGKCCEILSIRQQSVKSDEENLVEDMEHMHLLRNCLGSASRKKLNILSYHVLNKLNGVASVVEFLQTLLADTLQKLSTHDGSNSQRLENDVKELSYLMQLLCEDFGGEECWSSSKIVAGEFWTSQFSVVIECLSNLPETNKNKNLILQILSKIIDFGAINLNNKICLVSLLGLKSSVKKDVGKFIDIFMSRNSAEIGLYKELLYLSEEERKQSMNYLLCESETAICCVVSEKVCAACGLPLDPESGRGVVVFGNKNCGTLHADCVWSKK